MQSGTSALREERNLPGGVGSGCETLGVPDWTKTNFDDLRDVSPEHVWIQWRFAREALGSPELGVSRFTYEPGARMPWGHRHRQQEEAYVVIGGSGRAKLDDEIVELRVSDALRVAPAVIRSFEAGPDGLDVICIGGRKPEGGDTERFEDFWD
jgi:mannose-6-phosphate isomerase-like protein (cupin superfamily)